MPLPTLKRNKISTHFQLFNAKLPVILIALLLFAMSSILCMATAHANDKATRVLFVGNSLTYVANLPAVFDALSLNNRHPFVSDMLAQGGATLTERVQDKSVEQALASQAYSYVILQERGGDFLCAFGPQSCEDANASLKHLVNLARQYHVTPIFLGSYQVHPGASISIVEAEQEAATNAAVAYIPVSAKLQIALQVAPKLAWLNQDKAHPGHDLALLQAAMLYIEITRQTIDATDLTVYAPMYKPNTRIAPIIINSTGDGTSSDVYVYSAQVLSTIVAITNQSALTEVSHDLSHPLTAILDQ